VHSAPRRALAVRRVVVTCVGPAKSTWKYLWCRFGMTYHPQVSWPAVRRVSGVLLAVLRWWFGTTWALAGVGSVIAAPIWIAEGNWGGPYMFGGGLELLGGAWLIHPWGLQRRKSRHRGEAVPAGLDVWAGTD
jgi:hypothetical protein